MISLRVSSPALIFSVGFFNYVRIQSVVIQVKLFLLLPIDRAEALFFLIGLFSLELILFSVIRVYFLLFFRIFASELESHFGDSELTGFAGEVLVRLTRKQRSVVSI